jgi:23S rRNA (adenine2503-C2)-methyltransferase
MPQHPPPNELLSLSNQELSDLAEKLGEARYRGRQLADAIFRQRRASLDQVLTLPGAFKSRLAEEGVVVGFPRIEQKFTSVDGTVRYLVAFADGQSVETVWMPEGDLGEAGDGTEAGQEELAQLSGEQSTAKSSAPRSRATICVSSQVGCAVNCQFCLTALLGVKRNLTAGEIVGQVLAVLGDHSVDLERERMNIVFMGMGEPFLNYDNFMKAVHLLVGEVRFPESRMTVSTSGIVPRIYDFAGEAIRPKLAISLNAPNDEIRETIMPVTRKWNIEAVMDAARQFPLRPRERITFEYVLLEGVNDGPEHAHEVARRIRDIRCKVNLIAFNPGPGVPYRMPAHDRVLGFQSILVNAGVPAFIRRPRGRDIYAACGQLKRTVA